MREYAEYSLEEMKVLVLSFADHIGKGFSKESFVDCDYRTIERHLEKYAEDLQSEKKELDKAYRKGRFEWESIGVKMAKTNEGNATSWIFNMKNRYPDEWSDKTKTELSGNVGIKKPSWFDNGEYEAKGQ